MKAVSARRRRWSLGKRHLRPRPMQRSNTGAGKTSRRLRCQADTGPDRRVATGIEAARDGGCSIAPRSTAGAATIILANTILRRAVHLPRQRTRRCPRATSYGEYTPGSPTVCRHRASYGNLQSDAGLVLMYIQESNMAGVRPQGLECPCSMVKWRVVGTCF